MQISIEKIKKEIAPTLKRHGVSKSALFGSVAKGNAGSKSDVDILVKFRSNKKTLLDLVGLKLDLEKKLRAKVDVLTYDSINPLLKKIILNERVKIL